MPKWALIRLDGADSAMLHAVAAGDESAMQSGMRVRARWREERAGLITDIECFVPDGGPGLAPGGDKPRPAEGGS